MTLQYVILGNPVAYSLSPSIQNAAFRYAGLDAIYGRRQVDDEGLAEAIDQIRLGELDGANVTMPHKHQASAMADEVIGLASQMGAANTLWRDDGRVVAASTDPDGVRFAWSCAGLPEDRPVLILGAGGAAAAAALALSDRALRVSARREEAARAMVVRLGVDASVIPWGRPLPGCVLVNATPGGREGGVLPPEVIAGAIGLLEMSYGDGPSLTESDFARRSLPIATGKMMLVGQGAASFRLWTGDEVPHSVMFDAISNAESG